MAQRDEQIKLFCPLSIHVDIIPEQNPLSGQVEPKPINVTFPCRADCAWYLRDTDSCAVVAIATGVRKCRSQE